jgi:predicted metal-dependent HD superfamily phosphohydrolase
MSTLKMLWDESRLGLGIGPDEQGYARLCAHYMEPHRRYHDLGHIEACLRLFDGVRHLAERPSEVATALFFHDVIYQPLARDNEAQSAAYMRAMLSAAGADRLAIERIEAAILCTQHHDRPPSVDAALVLDIDMSILAERPEVFDAYEDAVRAEYAVVDDASFAAGRSAFVRSTLERPVIFHTPELAARWDAAARTNLRRALERWGR